jgi:hypothetical protein
MSFYNYQLKQRRKRKDVTTTRDDNSATGTETIFYPWVALIPDPNRDRYFFPSTSNPTGTRYFTTIIILGCEQVKIYSFYYFFCEKFILLY